MTALAAHHEVDPKQDIFDRIKEHIEDVEIFRNSILLGIYERPEKTKGGIILTDKFRNEDKFQGKAGLVLKLGPAVFKDEPDNGIYFYSQTVEIGDWIGIMPSDGWPVTVGDVSCRVVKDTDVKLRIKAPDVVF